MKSSCWGNKRQKCTRSWDIPENALRQFQKLMQTGISRHVLGQVGEEHGDVEADVFGWLVEALHKCLVVQQLPVVRLHAGEQELCVGERIEPAGFHGLLNVLLGDEAPSVRVKLFKSVRWGQVFEFQEHVKEPQNQLHVAEGLHQHVHHLFADSAVHHISYWVMKWVSIQRYVGFLGKHTYIFVFKWSPSSMERSITTMSFCKSINSFSKSIWQESC